MASKLNGPDLLETARPNTELCDTVKCQLCDVVRQPNQLCDAARTELNVIARTEFLHLPQAELCDTAGATQRVNARSPLVDSKGQWALSTVKEAVGLYSRTPIATVQVFCALP